MRYGKLVVGVSSLNDTVKSSTFVTPAGESTPLKAEPACDVASVSSRAYVAITSSALNGLPLANFTPWRILYVHSLPSAFGFQLTASSGVDREVLLRCG